MTELRNPVGSYEAILLISFGGPEGMDDVIPYLENVLRGRNVPRERMLEVAHHYEQFGGVSPINQQMRDLLDVLKPALQEAGIQLPVYWGNRNWKPYLNDVIPQMAEDGIQSALGLVVSAYSSYSGCRQYRENVIDAQEPLGEKAPQIDKLRVFYNHPLFIESSVARLQEAINELPESERGCCHIAFTAHSLPQSMADSCQYVQQLTETARLVTEQLSIPEERYSLVYQSRSGRPQDPWLEPDILDHLADLKSQGSSSVVIDPIGFLSDHMEVLFDLDVEARQWADENSIPMARAKTVGTHPQFVEMLVELIQERLDEDVPKRAIGRFPANHDFCPLDCCPAPRRPPQRPATS